MADTQDVMRGFEWQTGNQVANLQGMTSAFHGLNTAGDVRAKYGIKDTSAMFDPLFKSLATNRARRLSGAAARAGRSASPEQSYAAAEQDYEGGLNELLGKKSQADVEQQMAVANLLHGAKGQQDSFGLGKSGQILGGLGQAHGMTLGREQFNMQNKPPSFGDYFTQILGSGVKAAGSMFGAPSSVFNFSTGGQTPLSTDRTSTASRKGPL